MISSNISDIPWLNQPNPGEYMLQSTQVAQGTARNFMQAAQFAQESAREQAMMPLKMAAMENQVKSNALEIQNGMYRQQDYLLNKAAFTELSKAAAEISAAGAWANPKSETRVWDIAAQFPSVTGTPEFQNVIKQFDVAGAATIKKQEAENRAAALENQLTLGRERIALTEEKYKAELASNEKNVAAKNAAMIEAAKARALLQGRDVLPDALYRKFMGTVEAITESSEYRDATQKEAAMNRAFERLKVEAENLKKGGSAGGTNEVSRKTPDGRTAIFDSATKKFLRYAQ
jgi:hypothetical protein